MPVARRTPPALACITRRTLVGLFVEWKQLEVHFVGEHIHHFRASDSIPQRVVHYLGDNDSTHLLAWTGYVLLNSANVTEYLTHC